VTTFFNFSTIYTDTYTTNEPYVLVVVEGSRSGADFVVTIDQGLSTEISFETEPCRNFNGLGCRKHIVVGPFVLRPGKGNDLHTVHVRARTGTLVDESPSVLTIELLNNATQSGLSRTVSSINRGMGIETFQLYPKGVDKECVLDAVSIPCPANVSTLELENVDPAQGHSLCVATHSEPLPSCYAWKGASHDPNANAQNNFRLSLFPYSGGNDLIDFNTITTDASLLDTFITVVPPQQHASAFALFQFHSTRVGCNFIYTLDGQPPVVVSVSSPSSSSVLHVLARLSNGAHTLSVVAKCTNGTSLVDGTPAVYSWHVQTTTVSWETRTVTVTVQEEGECDV
jgi:hypothetical protein